MKKMMLGAALVAAAVAMTGCHSIEQDKWVLPADQIVLANAFRPDVKILKNELVSGEAHFVKTWWFVTEEGPTERAIEMDSSGTLPLMGLAREVAQAALYDACRKAGADMLIAPRYTIQDDSSFLWFSRDMKVTVQGIPAVIDGAHEVRLTDEQIIQIKKYR